MIVCFFLDMTEYWLGMKFNPAKNKFVTLETKKEIDGPDGPSGCMYPGFVGRDYRTDPSRERCLQMRGSAWIASPCLVAQPLPGICQYGTACKI